MRDDVLQLQLRMNCNSERITTGRKNTMHLQSTRAALMLGCAVISAPTFAADGSADENVVSDTEIVVVGSPDKADKIAGSFAVVNEEDLKRSRVLNVNDALRQAPGVFPRDEDGSGLRPNISIRGLNPLRSGKVLLLEDGLPLGFAPYGDNDAYYHPPIQRFTSLEVLKGASQVRFGPQTIAGVVNYITPEVPTDLVAEATLAAGNRDMLMLDGKLGGRVLGGGLIAHVVHNQTDGNRDNQSFKFTDIFIKGGWELGRNHALTVKLSGYLEKSQVSYAGLTEAEFAANPRGNVFLNDSFESERFSAVLAHRWNLSDDLTLKTSAYYHYFARDSWRQGNSSTSRPNDMSDPTCGGMANLSTTCGTEGRLRDYDTYGIETRLSIDHNLLGFGGETEIGVRLHEERQNRRQWNADTPLGRTPGTSVNAGVRENQQRNITAFSAFVQSRLEFGGFALIPGSRAEFIDFTRINLPIDVRGNNRPTGAVTAITSGGESLSKVVPGLGATWSIVPDVTLYGGVHRGFAPPRVQDVINSQGGSVDLDPELSTNWEIGLRGDIVKGLRADANFFVLDFENQIISQSVAGGVGTALTSAGRTMHRGAEGSIMLSSRVAGWTGPDTEVFARLAATWLGTARFNSTRIATLPCFGGAASGTTVLTANGPVPCGMAQDVNGNRLPYSPEWLLSAAIGVEHTGFTGQLERVSQSSMFADDVNQITPNPNGQRGLIEGWTQFNVALSYGPPGGRWEVFTTVRNIFDRLYVVDRARGILPGQPFTIQTGVTLRY
jgi:Fe(3+) dicitrate transport protein